MTHRERECIDFIRAYQERNGGVSPTYDEIREALGLASKSGVSRMMDALEKQGRLRRSHCSTRAITLLAEHVDLSSVPTDALIAELDKRLPFGSARFAFDPVHAERMHHDAR